jgi:hypothetical protein
MHRTDVHILLRLSVNLNMQLYQYNLGRGQGFECELTIVDDERDVGNLRGFNLNVVHDKNLRRQLPH